jgi:galactokinase
MMDINDLKGLAVSFQKRYGKPPRLFRAPGRVNLIGEHTDYNEGFVLPIAIDRDTLVAIAERSDKILNAWSLNLQESFKLDLNNLSPGRNGTWQDYVEGIAAALIDRGVDIPGVDIAIRSDVPIGGGLSSSAALEIALGKAFLTISGAQMDGLTLAIAGQSAEHRHVGINCGIMDQYTAIHAHRNHAILLDCRSLKASSIPLNLKDYQIVVCNSGVHHSLATSKYNQRRLDCERGTEALRTVLPEIHSLRDVSFTDFQTHRSLLPDLIMRRCRHVISENERTLKASESLSAGDVTTMGALMLDSHLSLRDDYQVSCRELDWLVEIAMAQSGILGARMTGGGFGGCTINLVQQGGIDSFRENVSQEYLSKTGLISEVFAVDSGEGACEVFY